MKKVEFIDCSRYPRCWVCGGTGIKDVENLKNITKCPTCHICKGTSKWKENFYHLIYTNKKGQKLCFGVDGLK